MVVGAQRENILYIVRAPATDLVVVLGHLLCMRVYELFLGNCCSWRFGGMRNLSSSFSESFLINCCSGYLRWPCIGNNLKGAKELLPDCSPHPKFKSRWLTASSAQASQTSSLTMGEIAAQKAEGQVVFQQVRILTITRRKKEKTN